MGEEIGKLRRELGHRWGQYLLTLLVGLTLLLGNVPLAAEAGGPPGDRVDAIVREMASRDPNGTIPVIVLRENRGAALAAIGAHGGKVRGQLKIKNAVAADVPAGRILALAREPGVTRIAFDAPMLKQGVLEDSLASDLRTVYPIAVRSTELWSAVPAIQGTGVGVAVIDTGLNNVGDFRGADLTGSHPAGSRLRAQIDLTGYGLSDENGHGTFVAGIAGGRGWGGPDGQDAGQYIGVAPDVSLISLKVGDQNGMSRVSHVIKAIEWAEENRAAYNIRVINISLLAAVAESYKTSLLDAAVELAWLKGLVVVVAAGNGGPNTMLYAPANDPFVITVGATDDQGTKWIGDDQLAWFSSYGVTQDGFAKPELVAPGRRLVSTLASTSSTLAIQYPNRVIDGLYIRLSGTSAAAPVVSGVIAQLLQARPTLTPNEVKGLLTDTGQPLAGQGLGAGYPSAAGAVKYTGLVGLANRGLVPNDYVARVGYFALTGQSSVSWDTVSWDTVSWDTVSWDTVSWDTVSWDTVSWDTVSWDTVSWDVIAED